MSAPGRWTTILRNLLRADDANPEATARMMRIIAALASHPAKLEAWLRAGEARVRANKKRGAA